MPRTHRQHCAFTQHQVAQLVWDSLQPLGQCRSLVGKDAISEKHARMSLDALHLQTQVSLDKASPNVLFPQLALPYPLSSTKPSTLILLSFPSSSPSDPGLRWPPQLHCSLPPLHPISNSPGGPPHPRRLLPSAHTPSHRSLFSPLRRLPSHLHSFCFPGWLGGKGGVQALVRGTKKIGEQGCRTPSAYSRACVLTHHRSFRCWGRSLSDR